MCAWKSKVDGTGVGIMILRWSSADLEMHQFGEAVWPMCSKDLQGFLLFHALVEEHVADFVHIKAEAERNRNQGASFHILGCQELTV